MDTQGIKAHFKMMAEYIGARLGTNTYCYTHLKLSISHLCAYLINIFKFE